jgi:hypothetical protein
MGDLPAVALPVRKAQTDAHYGGNLIAGAKLLEIFGDLATGTFVVKKDQQRRG